MKKSIIALLGLAAIGFSAECLATETVYNIAHFMRENGCGNPANPIIDTYHEHEVQVYKNWTATDPNSSANLMHGYFQADGRVTYAEGATATSTEGIDNVIPVVEYSRNGINVQTTAMNEPITADTLAFHPCHTAAAALGFRTMKGGTYRMRFRVKRLANNGWTGKSTDGTGSQMYANNQTTTLGKKVYTTKDFAWSAWEESANQVLAPGEAIYFKLDANDDHGSDYTLVQLEVIATDETPSPSPVVNPVTIDLTKMVDDYVAAHSSGFPAIFDLGSRFKFYAGVESDTSLGTWGSPFDICNANPFSNANLPGWATVVNDYVSAVANITAGDVTTGSRQCWAGEMAAHPGNKERSSTLRFEAKEAIATANGDLEVNFRDLNDYSGGASHGVWVRLWLNGVELDKRWCCNRCTNDVAKVRLTSDLAAGDKIDVTVTKTDKVSCDATAIGLKLVIPGGGDKGILYIK